ncbi:hypothetical protein A2U01_0059210, partial [Trifolium medium]|nr:hypothetical protein [Trifolium medium]
VMVLVAMRRWKRQRGVPSSLPSANGVGTDREGDSGRRVM